MNRLLSLCLLTTFVIILAGCGANSGPAEPVSDGSEIDQFLAENPEIDQESDDDELMDSDDE